MDPAEFDEAGFLLESRALMLDWGFPLDPFVGETVTDADRPPQAAAAIPANTAPAPRGC